MTLPRERTDIPLAERSRMLDTLYEAFEKDKIDVNYSLLIYPNDLQAYSLVYGYNRIVKAENRLDPNDAQAMFTRPGDGYKLDQQCSICISPPKEFLKDGDKAFDNNTHQFQVECNNSIEEGGEYVSGDANKGDDVKVYRFQLLTDKDLEKATMYLDWSELREIAIKHGYEPAQKAEKSRSVGDGAGPSLGA